MPSGRALGLATKPCKDLDANGGSAYLGNVQRRRAACRRSSAHVDDPCAKACVPPGDGRARYPPFARRLMRRADGVGAGTRAARRFPLTKSKFDLAAERPILARSAAPAHLRWDRGRQSCVEHRASAPADEMALPSMSETQHVCWVHLPRCCLLQECRVPAASSASATFMMQRLATTTTGRATR